MSGEPLPAPPLTEQIVVDLSLAAVIDYLSALEEGSSHDDALDYVRSQAAESYVCLAGECNH